MKKLHRVLVRLSVWVFVLSASTLLAQTHFQFSPDSHRARRRHVSAPTPVPPTAGVNFGDPLPGLTLDQLADFLEGQDEFANEDTPESGLGPVFNNVSCIACHSSPASGGASDILETRFGRLSHGRFDPLAEKGGSLLQDFAIDPLIKETLPPEANVVAKRQTTPLFGLGLIEAIPDQQIVRNARERKPDGISGRVAFITDVVSGEIRVGRFGWKNQQATLLAFSGDAYLNEIGITSRLFPFENPPNGDTNLLAIYDLVPDPEDTVDPATGKADIDLFTDFMRFLAPPPPLPLTRSAKAGQALFDQINCTACHQPVMFTGSNDVAALDRKAVALYSDLLLHDMGSLGDGIAQAAANPREMRTAPLWGLRASPPYLHDGRAATVDQAIRAHDGEATMARSRYLRLSPDQRRQLLEFLNSL